MKIKKVLLGIIIGFSILAICFLLVLLIESLISENSKASQIPNREDLIPQEIYKMSPDNDPNPPLSLSDEYEDPLPLPYPVNTRGAEDSPFIMPNGETLYVWFTPDANADITTQAVDKATGIYRFRKTTDGWSAAERLWLEDADKAHLDGCGFFQDNQIWFCGVREGIEGMRWFSSQEMENVWSSPEIVDFIPGDEVGELHISSDGTELYFHSYRPGGLGGMDIWLSRNVDGVWQEPENLTNVNSEYDEGWPALSPDESELWISRNYGLWRSKKVDGVWQISELMISPLAGEATIDNQGNVYFTHHFYVDDQKIEVDIYIARKK